MYGDETSGARPRVADVMNGENVGMVQRRGRPRFLIEPLHAVTVGRKHGRQDLDGDVTPQPRVAGPVDLTHPAGADQSGDLIRAEAST